MSFHTFFDFTTGLSVPITAPKGTYKLIMHHVRHIETTLGFESEQYLDNPQHWRSTKPKDGVPDKALCKAAEQHNHWVCGLYEDFAKWSEAPPADGETITPEMAREFWHGLQRIRVPPDRWTADYYQARMNALFLAMQGSEYIYGTDGMSFDADPLTQAQAGAVIRLFDQYLDAHDLRLEVPEDRNTLYSSNEYEYCEGCGKFFHIDDCHDCGHAGGIDE